MIRVEPDKSVNLGKRPPKRELAELEQIHLRTAKHDETYKVVLSYPLEVEATFDLVLTPTTSLADLVLAVQSAYQDIYRSQSSREEFGVWGHERKDLWFESADVDKGRRRIVVNVGS